MKTIIITGSAGNLGKATAHKFIGMGYRVIGTVTRISSDNNGLPKDAFEEVVVDVSNEQASKQLIKNTAARFGSIDAAVLTVGGFAKGSIAETGMESVFQQFKMNFETAYNVAQPLFKQMVKQNGGRIFLIGSRAGLEARSSKGMAAYGLSKSLIFRLAELLNDEGHNHNVITSVVVPSTIDTLVNRQFMPDADFESWVKPEAIAEIIFFYCSDAAAALREPVIKVYNNA
jgi:NAD(P)-dependent dehydrogenase (short-subunit alcohol dehydrogenase family)